MLTLEMSQVKNKITEIVNELLIGGGAVLVKRAFSADEVKVARDAILHYSTNESDKATHFHGANEDKIHLQRRVWNLLNKGQVFERMVQKSEVVAVLNEFLGNEFILGSIAANRLMPGAAGQEPHVDYPYLDIFKPGSFPKNMNSSFALNAQVTILLDEFTTDNGATAYTPGSQRELSWPLNADEFYKGASRQLGEAGDCVIFNGMVWHCAMPNNSNADRIGVLIQYLAKFVTPFEDQKNGVSPEVLSRATPVLKRLLGGNYPFPHMMDELPAENAYGLTSEN
jgi:ectoine hydroxylase-related dioxygenase (phytanoyl-CoA dioxygenase family)